MLHKHECLSVSPRVHIKKLGMAVCTVFPALGGQRQVHLWSSLPGQPSLLGKLQEEEGGFL